MNLGRLSHSFLYLCSCLVLLLVCFITEGVAQNTQDRGTNVNENQQGLNTQCEFDQFKSALGARESSNNYTIVNQFGYMGRYQFGRATMNGLQANPAYNLPAVSNEEFLASPEIQERYFEALVQENQRLMVSNGMDQYIGRTINGVVVTESGILAAMHLKGPSAVRRYLESNGAVDGTDGNGTALSSYLSSFGGYDIPGGPGGDAGDGCGFVPQVQSPRDQGYEGCCPRFCDLPPRSLGMSAGIIPTVPPIVTPPYSDFRICDGNCPSPLTVESVQQAIANVRERCLERYRAEAIRELNRCIGGIPGGIDFPILPLTCGNITPEDTTNAITVSTPDELEAAVADRRMSGGTILLAAGNYGNMTSLLNNMNPSAPLIIASADPANAAIIEATDVRNSSNITFANLNFFANGTPELPRWNIDPPPRDGQFPELPSQPGGTGLRIRDSNNITVTGSNFSGHSRGISSSTSSNIRITNSMFNNTTMDHMAFTDIHGLLIEGNYTRGHQTLWRQHNDIIQFWNIPNTGPSSDIVIRNNVLTSSQLPGSNGSPQGIFMYNEEVQRNGGGPDEFYRNVLIENNTIITDHPNGMVLGAGDNIRVRNNTVRLDCAGERSPGRHPRINLHDQSTNVELTGNSTNQIQASGNDMVRPVTMPSSWANTSNTQTPDCMDSPVLTQAPGCMTPETP